MGEFDLIRQYFVRPGQRHTLLGPGDDAALLTPSPDKHLVVTTDMLVEGVHFFPDTNPEDLGWKTLAVNLSDLAAMGATPKWVVLAISLPQADREWVAAFTKGFHDCADTFAVDLVGGDTTQGPRNLCVTAFGEVRAGKALRRSAAQQGDDIWLSGYPGLAALGLRYLQGSITLSPHWQRLCVQRLQRPQPRVSLGLSLQGTAHSCIDISDGLFADLGHIAQASELQAHLLLHQLPRLPEGVERNIALECLLAGGDDYELCFTASSDKRLILAEMATNLDLPLWRIGEMVAMGDTQNRPVSLLGPDQEVIEWELRGYQHFAS